MTMMPLWYGQLPDDMLEAEQLLCDGLDEVLSNVLARRRTNPKVPTAPPALGRSYQVKNLWDEAEREGLVITIDDTGWVSVEL